MDAKETYEYRRVLAISETLQDQNQGLIAENKRLREVLTYARQALDTLGIGKRTREEAMRRIDEAMK